jgi:hypothetical protein
MGSEFETYFRLGIGHIADLEGYDHILFIIALTAGYAPRDWRRLLWLVTSFTAGHSITLALATLNVVRVHGPAVELLIAVTIAATALFSLVIHRRGADGGETVSPVSPVSPVSRTRQRLLYLLAGGFGLIHGLGFSSFLRAVLGGEDDILVPLFAFNVGLEFGQLAIVLAVLAVGALICDVAGLRRQRWAMALSLFAFAFGARMIFERIPAG